jgi:phosphopantothenoylcysteine decarboxylase
MMREGESPQDVSPGAARAEQAAEHADRRDLVGYELLVAVGGGIAAYKVAHVVSRLIQRGCGVTVAMTEGGTRFVTPLTFQSLTHRPVYTSTWQSVETCDPHHLSLTEKADLFLVAPATADLLGKFAAGIADDLVTTLMIGREGPALLAPAMNSRMWANPIVQGNVRRLGKFGFHFVEPAEGYLACGAFGPGRMAEPETILEAVARLLHLQKPKQQA